LYDLLGSINLLMEQSINITSEFPRKQVKFGISD